MAPRCSVEEGGDRGDGCAVTVPAAVHDAGGADGDTVADERETVVVEGLRKRGYSKGGRKDAAQVVIGWAVTRGGIPVRCWVWPGNSGDQYLVAEVKRDLNGWHPGRIITALDAGFNSEVNRRVLQE